MCDKITVQGGDLIINGSVVARCSSAHHVHASAEFECLFRGVAGYTDFNEGTSITDSQFHLYKYHPVHWAEGR